MQLHATIGQLFVLKQHKEWMMNQMSKRGRGGSDGLGGDGGCSPCPLSTGVVCQKIQRTRRACKLCKFLMGWAIKGMTNEGKKDDKSNVNEGKK